MIMIVTKDVALLECKFLSQTKISPNSSRIKK